MSFRFREGEGLAEGATRMARAQLGKAAGRLEGLAGPGRDLDEAVHDARKRIKKARAVLRLARGSIGRGRARKVDRGLRAAARPLGEARDASALRNALASLAREGDDPPLIGTFQEAGRVLDRRLDAAARGLIDGETAAHAARSLRKAIDRIGRWDLDDDDAPASGLKRALPAGPSRVRRRPGRPEPGTAPRLAEAGQGPRLSAPGPRRPVGRALGPGPPAGRAPGRRAGRDPRPRRPPGRPRKRGPGSDPPPDRSASGRSPTSRHRPGRGPLRRQARGIRPRGRPVA